MSSRGARPGDDVVERGHRRMVTQPVGFGANRRPSARVAADGVGS